MSVSVVSIFSEKEVQGLQGFAFCVVNITDEHTKLQKKV